MNAVYLNSIIALTSQILQVLLGFVIRKLFIIYLGVEYLGYNSVFTNILQMLNLTDMGIGIAIISFLYKPLAEEDNCRVKALMYLYKRIYEITGVAVLVIGIVVSFFLPMLIPDATCSRYYLMLFFYINLAITVSTYYISYKRTLLIANQKSYVTSMIDTISYLVMSVMQICIIIFYPNYVLYLIAILLKNIISNIIISFRSDHEYGKIGNQSNNMYYQEYKSQILSYVKEVFISRIGAFVYYSTDNIIISIFKGSLLTGYLSNYTLVTTQVTNVVNQILSSIQATFGNYISVNEDTKKQMDMTDNYLCVNYCIGNFCFGCLLFLIQPFIKLMFGQDYVLNTSTIVLLSINLMLTIMIQLPSQLFIIYKLYRFDKPIIIASATLNIIISCVLVKPLGIDGVLIGTFLTSLLYLFSRFYIISKHVYKIPYLHYLKQFCKYGLVSITSVAVIYLAMRGIQGDTIKSFAVRTIGVGMLTILLPSVLLCITKEFNFLVNKLVPRGIKQFYSKWVVGAFAVILTVAFYYYGVIEQSVNYTADPTNKSLPRQEIYICEATSYVKVLHLSIDDFIISFKDITDNENRYTSIFENSTFAWMKELHDKYGVVFSCYCYYEDGDFNLDMCTKKFINEFTANADWLRFGFHTVNNSTIYGEDGQHIIDDYNKTVTCLTKIVSNEAIDNVIRLHGFQGTVEQINELASADQEPVKGLLTADDRRQSYYLKPEDNNYIFTHDLFRDRKTGFIFISTDLRAEFMKNTTDKIEEFNNGSWNNQLGYLEIFSHEWILEDKVKNNFEALCVYAKDNGYAMMFYEDILKD